MMVKGIAALTAFLGAQAAAQSAIRSDYPVRDGERTLVWMTRFDSAGDSNARRRALKTAAKPLSSMPAKPSEVLRPEPTARSAIRALSAQDEAALHAWDFEFGTWSVRHRILKMRGKGSDQWEEVEGTSETRPHLGGVTNIEEQYFGSAKRSGMAIRTYDRARHLWSIYWIGGYDGQMQPPVTGNFDGDTGIFTADDTDGGRPIKVKFLWKKLTPATAHWEQAFSYDGGKSWEVNWTMDFTRQGK